MSTTTHGMFIKIIVDIRNVNSDEPDVHTQKTIEVPTSVEINEFIDYADWANQYAATCLLTNSAIRQSIEEYTKKLIQAEREDYQVEE